MGDRVLMQCFNSHTGEVGPVLYCHNAGYRAPEIVRKLAERMIERQGDLEYNSARLVQEAIAGQAGALSFGLSNAVAKLTDDDSPGDAGVILIDVAQRHRCECLGGYLMVGEDGFPTERARATGANA
ncbi:MAG: hypothetical protein FGM22_10935 [Burkholderiaceae bacterium]|nr:hypothetical protein [Burkholderiaceae bacterium]